VDDILDDHTGAAIEFREIEIDIVPTFEVVVVVSRYVGRAKPQLLIDLEINESLIDINYPSPHSHSRADLATEAAERRGRFHEVFVMYMPVKLPVYWTLEL
jgi:hypothetical protein